MGINYRLGPFGYLSLGTDSVPGSASIAFHLLSPRSKGLFQRAILQSGTALGYAWGGSITASKALQYSQLFAANLDCDEGDLVCLQSRDKNDIIMQSLMINNQYDAVLDYETAWLPVIDAEFTEDFFLPGNPIDLLESGEFNSEVDVIIGSNKDEGLLWMIYEMFTDAFPLFAVHQTMKAFLAQNMKVFHYILTYKGEFSLLDISYGLPPTGVCHADDLLYLFDPVFQYLGVDPDAPVLTGTDLEVSDLMISAWTNFAAFGDPTPPDMLDVTWVPAEPGNLQYLNISGPIPQMAYADNIRDRMQFWTELMK